MHSHICLYRRFVIVRGGFCARVLSVGFLSGRFCPGWFCPYHLLSEYIPYNKKLNITFNFRICMYETFVKSLTLHALGPPPVTNCHTFSDPSPLGSDVLYGRPLKY